MNSPVHPHLEMKRVKLKDDLPAWECLQSGGHWISADDYQAWLDRRGGIVPMTPAPETAPNPAQPEEQRARICPESGRLLVRYRVGKDVLFFIDRSPASGGVWLDRDEWETLKSRNLHDEIHLVFTAAWQKEIRDEARLKALRAHFAERIGAEAFARAEEMKRWLREQPARRDILIYLSDAAI